MLYIYIIYKVFAVVMFYVCGRNSFGKLNIFLVYLLWRRSFGFISILCAVDSLVWYERITCIWERLYYMAAAGNTLWFLLRFTLCLFYVQINQQFNLNVFFLEMANLEVLLLWQGITWFNGMHLIYVYLGI